MYCDGIIMLKLKQIFPKQTDLKVFLEGKGRELQIQKICESQYENCYYIRLEDSANEFNEEFIVKIKQIEIEIKALLRAKSKEPFEECIV